MLKEHDERIFISLTQNKVVQEALVEPPEQSVSERYEQFRRVQDFLAMGVNAGGITGVYLTGNNGLSFKSTDNVLDAALLTPEVWAPIRDHVLEMAGRAYWFVADNNIMGAGRGNLFLFMTRAIPTRISFKGFVGVGLMRVSYTRYVNTIKYALFSGSEYALLTDPDGLVLMHTGDSTAPGTAPEAAVAEFIAAGGSLL